MGRAVIGCISSAECPAVYQHGVHIRPVVIHIRLAAVHIRSSVVHIGSVCSVMYLHSISNQAVMVGEIKI